MLLVCVVASAAEQRRAGTDWPGFLGPTGDGVSSETGLLERVPEQGPRIVWQHEAGEGYGAPSIADGRLYLFDRVGDRARLTCRDSETGRPLWVRDYETQYEDPYGFSGGPRAVPVVDGDRVYTFGVEGRLRCHRAQDGKLLWDVDTAAEFGVVQNFFGVGSTPVVEGELLIVPVGGSAKDSPGVQSGEVQPNGSGIVAFDKRKGKVEWRAGDELASYSSPVAATVGERRLMFWFARGGLLAFRPADGKIEFSLPWRAKKLESVNAANPVVVGDRVFITEAYAPGGALLQVKSDGVEVLWKDGRRDQALASHRSTPVHHEGILYGCHGQGSGEAELRAVELATGMVRWKHPGLGRTTTLLVEGHLIVLGERGRVLLVEATPEAYREVADWTPTDDEGKSLLEYPAWNAPVLSHGLLYLRGKERLVCLDLTPPPDATKPTRGR
ncbi:MAG: PQQ-binding-like beta-propeller repeat protein [bacterium]|nr:PQQ-binding-like beta-propeller repeat protein [bacterium]